MKYLLDSNAIICLLKGNAAFLERLHQHHPQDFGVPAIVMHELFYGAYKSQRTEENMRRVEGVRFEVVEFDTEDSRKSGELRDRLAAAGTPIGPLDVLIAGQALARDLILVTHNMREFQRVPGLRVEDWE